MEKLSLRLWAAATMKILAILFGCFVCTAAMTGFPDANHAFEIDAGVLEGLQYPAPDSVDARKYLGLSGTGAFRLSQIRADLVVVEVFNMYCPHCQAEAPNVNRLHKLIEDNPSLKSHVRLVGIGVGNTPLEVDLFRKKFHVPFPLFPDDESTIARSARDGFKTPTFIVLKLGKRSKLNIVKVHVGRIGDLEDFLRSFGGP